MTVMAATTEELELQDHVTRVLESQGVLGKIKAQLRAAVFQTIHSANRHDDLGTRPSQSSVVPATAMLQSFDTDGSVALELVRNFLECLELDHTLTVFEAEAGLDGNTSGKSTSAWRMPARLCERMQVPATDETTPVLIKILRRDGGNEHMRKTAERGAEPVDDFGPSLARANGSVGTIRSQTVGSFSADLPSPPIKASPGPILTTSQKPLEEDDGEMDTSMAEEIASGSFEEESLAESANASQSQCEDVPSKLTTTRMDRFSIEREEEEDPSPSIASPPPVPTKLGPLPSLPGIGSTSSVSKLAQDASDDENDDEEDDRPRISPPHDEDEDDDLDDDAAAARLRSLEEKLKKMEAEDDTGVLQQLKETALDEGDEMESPSKVSSTPPSEKRDEDDGDDNYGSDFEEVEEEEDVASELSEDIASVSMLSESEEIATFPTMKQTLHILDNDKAVESEDALNSYDYIETVEKQS